MSRPIDYVLKCNKPGKCILITGGCGKRGVQLSKCLADDKYEDCVIKTKT